MEWIRYELLCKDRELGQIDAKFSEFGRWLAPDKSLWYLTKKEYNRWLYLGENGGIEITGYPAISGIRLSFVANVNLTYVKMLIDDILGWCGPNSEINKPWQNRNWEQEIMNLWSLSAKTDYGIGLNIPLEIFEVALLERPDENIKVKKLDETADVREYQLLSRLDETIITEMKLSQPPTMQETRLFLIPNIPDDSPIPFDFDPNKILIGHTLGFLARVIRHAHAICDRQIEAKSNTDDFVQVSWKHTGTWDSFRITASEAQNFHPMALGLSDKEHWEKIADVRPAPIGNVQEHGSSKTGFAITKKRAWSADYSDIDTIAETFNVFWTPRVSIDQLKLKQTSRGFDIFEIYEGREHPRGKVLFYRASNGDSTIAYEIYVAPPVSLIFPKSPSPFPESELENILEDFRKLTESAIPEQAAFTKFKKIRGKRIETPKTGGTVVWNGQIEDKNDIKTFDKAVISESGIIYENLTIEPFPVAVSNDNEAALMFTMPHSFFIDTSDRHFTAWLAEWAETRLWDNDTIALRPDIETPPDGRIIVNIVAMTGNFKLTPIAPNEKKMFIYTPYTLDKGLAITLKILPADNKIEIKPAWVYPEYWHIFEQLLQEIKQKWPGDSPGLIGGNEARMTGSNRVDWIMPTDDEARIKLVALRVKTIDKQDRIIKLAKDLLNFKVDRSKVEPSNIARYDSDRQLAKKAGLLPPDF